MAARDPDHRSAVNAANAGIRWSRITDRAKRSAGTAAARAARRKAIEERTDPDGILDPDERDRRVSAHIRTEMRRLAALAGAARAERRHQREIRDLEDAEAAEATAEAAT